MSERIKPVLCVGDLVADIFTSPIEEIPKPGAPIVTKNIAIYPGGNSLNTAVALSRMGDPVRIGGSIGDDVLGTLLIHHLQELGLDVAGVTAEKGETTASTIILRVEGEDRRYIMNLGVGENFTGEHLSFDLIPENGVVLAGGYLKLAAWDDDHLSEFLKQAQAKNNITVLNVCLVQNSDIDPERVLPLLKYVDVFLPNEDEARAITGEQELLKQSTVLHEAGARNVIITRGPQGLFASDRHNYINMGSFKVDVVDPSGCGDCFTAGCIAALRRGWDIASVLKFGSASGALGATALGCTNGIPVFSDINQFAKNNALEISILPVN
jgi:sugar/nucleoside kinase (ribokinase family)